MISKQDKTFTKTHTVQKSVPILQSVQDNSHVTTAQQPTQVIGPSSERNNGQTSPTAMETGTHVTEDQTASPTAKQTTSTSQHKDKCVEAEDNNNGSRQHTTPPVQALLCLLYTSPSPRD